MSDLFPLFDGEDGDGDDDGRHRASHGDGRRSAWAVLTVLAFAVTVVVLATLLLRSNTGSHHPANQLAGPSGLTSPSTTPTMATQIVGPSDVAVTTASTSPTSPHASKSPTATTSKSTSKTATPSRTPTPTRDSSSQASRTPTTTPTPTPTASSSSPAACPCSISGDGGAIAALNKARRNVVPRLPTAHGTVTTAAKSCAESLALGATAFCPPGYASAEEPSQDGRQAVADAYSNGGSWFTDPNLTSFQVGWAYDGAGHYYCVFIED